MRTFKDFCDAYRNGWLVISSFVLRSASEQQQVCGDSCSLEEIGVVAQNIHTSAIVGNNSEMQELRGCHHWEAAIKADIRGFLSDFVPDGLTLYRGFDYGRVVKRRLPLSEAQPTQTKCTSAGECENERWTTDWTTMYDAAKS